MMLNLTERFVFFKKLYSDYSPMQARWLFSDTFMGKRVTIEVISKVCIQYTYVCYQTSHEIFAPPQPDQT